MSRRFEEGAGAVDAGTSTTIKAAGVSRFPRRRKMESNHNERCRSST